MSVVFKTGATATAYPCVYQRITETTMRTHNAVPANLIQAVRLTVLTVLPVLAAACGKGTGGY